MAPTATASRAAAGVKTKASNVATAAGRRRQKTSVISDFQVVPFRNRERPAFRQCLAQCSSFSRALKCGHIASLVSANGKRNDPRNLDRTLDNQAAHFARRP